MRPMLRESRDRCGAGSSASASRRVEQSGRCLPPQVALAPREGRRGVVGNRARWRNLDAAVSGEVSHDMNVRTFSSLGEKGHGVVF